MHVNKHKQGKYISIHMVRSFSHHVYILSLRLDQFRSILLANFLVCHFVAAVYAPFMLWPR